VIHNHDGAPEALLVHLESYQKDSLTWHLRFAQDAHPVIGTDQYYDPSGIVLRHQFTHAGTRYFVGRDRKRFLIRWGTQPEESTSPAGGRE
jgi:hypothetical protein